MLTIYILYETCVQNIVKLNFYDFCGYSLIFCSCENDRHYSKKMLESYDPRSDFTNSILRTPSSILTRIPILIALMEQVVEMKCKSDRIMSTKLVVGQRSLM